ncbi:MAG TPA: two-component sensor histidine kinase [Lactobacillus sp.]|nr:two-component sensor histidine kinase [Lactobacillus sp.]
MRTLGRRLVFIACLVNIAVLIFLLAVIGRVPDPRLRVLAAVIIIAAMIIESLIILWLIANQQRVVSDLTTQVLRLSSPKDARRIILPDNHAYADLAQAINMAADELRHQSHVFQRQENELDNLLEYLPVGVIVIDRRRMTQLLNPMAAQLLEINVDSKPHLYTADVRQYDLTEQIEGTMRDHQNVRQTLTLQLPTSPRTLEVSTIYTEPRPDHQQVLVLLYDLTEVTQIEQMQLDFVSNASHELKTPLTAIAGFTETLLAGAKNDPEKRDEFLKIIDDQSHELMDLIEDVLSVSRLQNPVSQTATITTVDLRTLVERQLTLQAQSIQRRALHVTNSVPESARVETDAKKLEQIIKNLISNAIKYNRHAGQLAVTFHSSSDHGWQLSVKDTGYGIAKDQQSRIFERFYRGDPSRNKQRIPGTGLGLAIVHELTTLLKGEVSVQSQMDVGTTMTISFPK